MRKPTRQQGKLLKHLDLNTVQLQISSNKIQGCTDFHAKQAARFLQRHELSRRFVTLTHPNDKMAAAPVTKLHHPKSQRNRTKLRHDQRSPGE